MICEKHNREFILDVHSHERFCIECYSENTLEVSSGFVQVDKKELLKVCEIFTKNMNYENCHYGDANLLMKFVEKYLKE